MKEVEAYKVISLLTTTCGTWDDDNVQAWVELIVDLENVAAAMDATKTVVQSWKKPQRPPFGIWLDAYHSASRRGIGDRTAIPDRGTEVSLTEHLDWLLERQDWTELGVWEHHAQKWGVLPKDTNTFGATMAWTGELARWFQENPNWATTTVRASSRGESAVRTPKLPMNMGSYIRDPEAED